MEYLASFLSPEHLIQSGGILLIAAIVFAESGLLVGFFLPGDTLLFTAGFFAAQGHLSIGWLLMAVILAAIIGDNVGYSFGRRLGPRIFKRPDGIIFRQEYLENAEKFYEKHGGKTIILARFMPFIRTFAPVVAGIGKMEYKTFLSYNVIGGALWAIGVTLAGYFFGNIPIVKENFEKVIFLIIILSVLPAVYHIIKDPAARNGILKMLKLKK